MRNILLLLLVISFFASCKKDDNTDPLSKYRLKEYTKDHYKFTFEYDNLGRLIKSGTYYDEQLVYNTSYFYKYNHIDSLSTYSAYDTITYETFTYTPDTLFHLSYRYSFNDYTLLRYVINNNHYESIVYPLCVLGDSVFQCHYEVLHWDSDNLTYKYAYSNVGSYWPYYKNEAIFNDFPMTNAIISTYDEQPNPLKTIYEQVYPGVYSTSVNNVLKMVLSDMTGDTIIRKFAYTYNENGLPVSCSETQEKNNTALNQYIQLTTSSYTYVYEEFGQ